MIIRFESFPVGTRLFDQVLGVRFPAEPQVVEPSLAPGTHALSAKTPGAEFSGPLVAEFPSPQSAVRLTAGLDHASATIEATLRGLDVSGQIVAQDGPIPLGPGPTPIRTAMQLATPTAAI